MHTIRSTVVWLASALCVPTFAQPADHRLGDHPAVIVKRLEAQARYDYASKFYPHPAWLYLLPEAARPVADPSAALAVARRQPGESACGILESDHVACRRVQ